MLLPDEIEKKLINVTDRLFDLNGLSAYSALGKSTIRQYIRTHQLPHFKVGGKILIKRSEFDAWIENYRIGDAPGKDIFEKLDAMVADVMSDLVG